MPPVALFATVYGAGLWVGLVFLIPAGVVLASALLSLPLARLSLRLAVLAAVGLAGVAAGGVAGRDRARGCAAVWGAGRQAAIVRIHDAPGDRGLATASVLHAPPGCAGRLSLRVSDRSVPAGAVVVVAGTFRPGGPLLAKRIRVLDRGRHPRYVIRAVVRQRVRALYGARAPLVEALVLGQRADIPRDLRALFAESGLAHLLAISGLHVGFLASWLALLARAVGARRTAWLWAAGTVWLFVALLGFPAPATRAAVFVSLHGIARVRQRHPMPAAVLAVAVLVVLAITPHAITAVGAWLSVAAVWGTTLARRGLGTRRRLHRVRSLLSVSLGATLATAPITAFSFGAVAPVGVLANLAAVPLAGVAVPGVFLSLAAGGVAASGAGAVLALIEQVARAGAALPWGHVTGHPGLRFAAPWLGLLAVVGWLVIRRPARRVVGRRILLGLAAASWVLAVAGRDGAGRGAGALSLHFLDVGQGDAVALRTPRGRWVLVDAGPRQGARGDAGVRVVAPFLRRRGARVLDLFVVSHGDADHLGGVPATMRLLPPGLVLEPGQPLGTALYLEYLAAAHAVGAEWRPARTGDTLVIDGVTFAVLHPSAEWLAREIRPNENSVVIHVAYGAFDALLTGDVGGPVESLLVKRLQPVEVLKVGHHGSAFSTGPAWLEALRPKVGVISVGRNGYGHPAPAVVRRLRARRIALYRTDRGGTVTVTTDGRYFEVVQGAPNSLRARLTCRVLQWLRSRASSSTRNGCTPRPPENSPTSYTTWPSPPRASRRTSGAPGW